MRYRKLFYHVLIKRNIEKIVENQKTKKEKMRRYRIILILASPDNTDDGNDESGDFKDIYK